MLYFIYVETVKLNILIHFRVGWSSGPNEVKLIPTFILVRKGLPRTPEVLDAVATVKDNQTDKIQSPTIKTLDKEDVVVEKSKQSGMAQVNSVLVEKTFPDSGRRNEPKETVPKEGRILSKAERRREMEKIRDKDLFGVHGHDSLNGQLYRKKAAKTIPAVYPRGKISYIA